MNPDVHVHDYSYQSISCDHDIVQSDIEDVVTPPAPKSNGDAMSTTSSSCTSCHLCGYESGRHSNLKRHLKTMHQAVTSTEFQCCDINFQDKAEYRDHCRHAHRDGHACPTCQRRFSRRALLRRHQSVHTGYKEFSCHICSYASSHKSNLERHLKTHFGYKPLEIQRKRKSRRPSVHPQPDSTTRTFPSTTTVIKFPILRTILKTNSSCVSPPPPVYKSIKSKPRLSHSIESILNRKEKPRNSSFLPLQVPPLLPETSNQSNLLSRVPEDGSQIRKDEFVPNKTLLSTLHPSVEISPIINHSLSSSPFTSSSFDQELRNQQRDLVSLPSWRPPSWIYQDLRIFSPTNYIQTHVSPHDAWHLQGLPTSHIITNYFCPPYGNNRETILNPFFQIEGNTMQLI